MRGVTNSALLACLGLGLGLATVAAPRPAAADDISARLDTLERENAALRARLNRLETVKPAKLQQRPADMASGAPLVSHPRPQDSMAADLNYKAVAHLVNAPRFEISGTLSYLQPGAGNLEYGTLTNPLPPVTPHWNNQTLDPKYAPSFTVGARYIGSESNDFQVNWTHLRSNTSASFTALPTQMAGPPYLIGPESGLYKNGYGAVSHAYDAVNADLGHTFCVECAYQLRVFGGVAAARIGQNLSGLFVSNNGAASSGYTLSSVFTGAGPRVGVKGAYGIGDFQVIGEAAGSALIGTAQSRIDFTTLAPTFGLSSQYLASPDAMRVVPSFDARLATAYTFAPTAYGLFKLEAGYKVAVYFDAINAYAVTQVPTSLTLPPNGIYLATQQHVLSNFTDQGPYVTASWSFW